MVSKASDDLPLPLMPVNTTSLLRGIVRLIFLRLCSRAPYTSICWASAGLAGVFNIAWPLTTAVFSFVRPIAGFSINPQRYEIIPSLQRHVHLTLTDLQAI